MANSYDNLKAYGKHFIGFDEPSGNAMDTIGGYTGTLFGSPVRVDGWNGIGHAMSFNGVNQYVQFNNPIFPLGTKSIRFKLYVESGGANTQRVMANSHLTGESGYRFNVVDNNLYVSMITPSGGNTNFNAIVSIIKDRWIDILITYSHENNILTIFKDGVISTQEAFTETITTFSKNLSIGALGSNLGTDYFKGKIDAIEIYNKIISPIPDKYLVLHSSQYKYHNGTSWMTTTATQENFIQHGMSQLSQITESQWKELIGNKSVLMWTDFEPKKYESVVLNRDDFTAQKLLGNTPQAVYYTDSDPDQIVVATGIDPYSVYDYISETPEVLIYTETTDDIAVSTTTEPFTIYDEFGNEVEVLYYTDDETITEADLILEADWSPIDELDGDFEVVTWTDEDSATAKRTLEIKAIPNPKFVYSNSTTETYNELKDIVSKDLSTYYNKSNVRYLLSPNNQDWYSYQNKTFVKVSDLSNANILENGITFETLTNMNETDFSQWNFNTVNVGVYLEDDVRNTVISSISQIDVTSNLPSKTPKIEDVKLYILNTTAEINLDFNGLTLSGVLSDADMTRVQYRVKLNGVSYYPADGSFTPLSAPPENILITLESDDVKIDDWNTLEVEFQDFFGTTDTWSINFIGKYAGIMFVDEAGEYYSTDMGKVLQYLDFGTVLTGNVTPSYPIKIKNEYGFPIKDTKIVVNTESFADGLKVELKLSEGAKDFEEELLLGSFANDEEKTFYINMRSPITTVPNGNNMFDIYVVATRDV